jgi:hypothetical protein
VCCDCHCASRTSITPSHPPQSHYKKTKEHSKAAGAGWLQPSTFILLAYLHQLRHPGQNYLCARNIKTMRHVTDGDTLSRSSTVMARHSCPMVFILSVCESWTGSRKQVSLHKKSTSPRSHLARGLSTTPMTTRCRTLSEGGCAIDRVLNAQEKATTRKDFAKALAPDCSKDLLPLASQSWP